MGSHFCGSFDPHANDIFLQSSIVERGRDVVGKAIHKSLTAVSFAVIRVRDVCGEIFAERRLKIDSKTFSIAHRVISTPGKRVIGVIKEEAAICPRFSFSSQRKNTKSSSKVKNTPARVSLTQVAKFLLIFRFSVHFPLRHAAAAGIAELRNLYLLLEPANENLRSS